MNLSDIKYCSNYCEENIWFLAQRREFTSNIKTVLFISNFDQQCQFYNQQAGRLGSIIWDYHVVLIVEDWVWDLDTCLPLPVPRLEYLEKTFSETTEERLFPLFKCVPAEVYIREFASDRSHMLEDNQEFIHPPPPWPCIRGNKLPNLPQFINMKDETLGPVYSLADFKQQNKRLNI